MIRTRLTETLGIDHPIVTHNLPASEATFDAARAEGVPVALFSSGEPTEWVTRACGAGARTICQVQTMVGAEASVGNEAGGHTGCNKLLPFLAQAVEAFPHVAVIVAGGITNGRALAAVVFRVRRNAFIDEWLGREDELRSVSGELAAGYFDAQIIGEAERLLVGGASQVLRRGSTEANRTSRRRPLEPPVPSGEVPQP